MNDDYLGPDEEVIKDVARSRQCHQIILINVFHLQPRVMYKHRKASNRVMQYFVGKEQTI